MNYGVAVLVFSIIAFINVMIFGILLKNLSYEFKRYKKYIEIKQNFISRQIALLREVHGWPSVEDLKTKPLEDLIFNDKIITHTHQMKEPQND